MMSAQGIGITTNEKQRESAEKNLADPFALFTKPGIEEDHISKEEVKFRPILPITQGGDIVFEIKTHGNYFDSYTVNTEYKLEIENEDGETAITAADDVAPINMLGATLWKDIKVSFRSVTKLNPAL